MTKDSSAFGDSCYEKFIRDNDNTNSILYNKTIHIKIDNDVFSDLSWHIIATASGRCWYPKTIPVVEDTIIQASSSGCNDGML